MRKFIFLILGVSFGAAFGDTIHVCFVSDEKYMEPTTVALASILKNSARDDEFHFYLLEFGVSKKSESNILALKKIRNFEIDFLTLENQKIKTIPVDNREFSRNIGHMAYGRLFLADLLPHLDKILYLDGDILVRNSLKPLWNTDIKDYYLGAIADIHTQDDLARLKHLNFILSYKNKNSKRDYFNSGVLLMNLKKFRQDKILDKILARIFELFKFNHLDFHDQDALNNLLGSKTKFLNIKFNYLASYENIRPQNLCSKNAVIVHFAGGISKIWDWFSVVGSEEIALEYFDVQKLTNYWGVVHTLHKYWSLYVWSPFTKAAIYVDRLCERLLGKKVGEKI